MATKTLYKIQIGAYKQKENAEKTAAVVRIQKFPAAVIQINGLWKVQSGAFSVKSNAEKRLKDIHEAGLHLKDPYKSYKNTFRKAIMVTVPGSEDAAKVATAFDKVKSVLDSIMKSSNPHQKVIDILAKHGHTLKWSSAWCSETVVSAFLESGYGYLIGGWAADAPTLKRHGKKLGIWHDGSSGIKAGDIVLYGSGEPNHTEFAIDGTYNISGNYNGTVAKRKRSGRKIHGYLRPDYPVVKEGDQQKPAEVTGGNKISIVPLAFFDTGDESAQYGDCTLILQYSSDEKTVEHAVMIDCGMDVSTANIIKKCKALGVTKLDSIVISHAHGDHYGGCSDIIKAFGCNDIYVPDPTQVSKYQKSYGDALKRQYKKTKGHYISKGTAWTVGDIHFECIYMCNASDLKGHDDHYFINNMSAVLRVTVNGWVYHTAGDLQNEGNNLLIKALGKEKLKADIFKCQWHGDANACNEAICNAVCPVIAFSNYHHDESNGGRKITRKRLEAVGAVVVTNHKNGDIYFDCRPGKMVVTCSKKNFEKTFYKAA